jgi:hypothetical protein
VPQRYNIKVESAADSHYLTRKAVSCDLILPNALSSAEGATACSFANVFAAGLCRKKLLSNPATGGRIPLPETFSVWAKNRRSQ